MLRDACRRELSEIVSSLINTAWAPHNPNRLKTAYLPRATRFWQYAGTIPGTPTIRLSAVQTRSCTKRSCFQGAQLPPRGWLGWLITMMVLQPGSGVDTTFRLEACFVNRSFYARARLLLTTLGSSQKTKAHATAGTEGSQQRR